MKQAQSTQCAGLGVNGVPDQLDLLTDSDLALAAQDDHRLFEALYLRYADQVYRYVLRRTGSVTIADDVLSDTTAELLENLGRFDPARGSFQAWLFTIVRRRISDHQRYASRLRRFIARRGVQLTTAPPGDDPHEAAIRNDEAERVQVVLDQLPDADRDLVLLKYAAQLTAREIAELVGSTDGAVRVRLHRIRKQIAEELDETNG